MNLHLYALNGDKGNVNPTTRVVNEGEWFFKLFCRIFELVAFYLESPIDFPSDETIRFAINERKERGNICSEKISPVRFSFGSEYGLVLSVFQRYAPDYREQERGGREGEFLVSTARCNELSPQPMMRTARHITPDNTLLFLSLVLKSSKRKQLDGRSLIFLPRIRRDFTTTRARNRSDVYGREPLYFDCFASLPLFLLLLYIFPIA